MVAEKVYSTKEYQEKYNSLVEREIMESIGSRKFGPTYKKKFLVFYKGTTGSMRNYLKSFIFFKVRDYKKKIETELDEKIKQTLEKELKIYYDLFEEIIEIRGTV